MNKILHTKWGKAKICDEGYYRITSAKEGNGMKLLHRLIWEDFWRTEVPKGYVIHHKNGNKLDNCILNLQLIRASEHLKLHRTGVKHPIGRKINMSNSTNTTGYFRVSKTKCKSCNQGFLWRYQYCDENGKTKSITAVDIKKLKEKVKSKGLLWRKLE